MRITFLISQHEKCIKILELAERSEIGIIAMRKDLKYFISLGPGARHKLPMFNEEKAKERIQQQQKVTARLHQYYLNTISKLEKIAPL